MARNFDEGQMLSLAEVHHLLEKERAARGELSYEQKLSLEHAKAFDRIGDPEKAIEMMDELLELDRVSKQHALKIADLFPTSVEELRTVFTEDRQDLDDEDADTIMSILEDYR